MKRIGMLTSGGDCQSLNATMRGVVKGLNVLEGTVEIYGFIDGYKGLIYGNYKRLTSKDFSGILTTGGTILGTSRQPFKLMRTPDENGLDKVEAMKSTYRYLDLDCLVVLGGNGSQKTANLLREEGLNIVSLPKTIDNDLPLPENIPTFGYQSAKAAGSTIATTIYEDARTSGNWFVVAAMGRSAGHLALGIAATAHYPMIVIPEMFNKTEITAQKILNLAISAIIKRKIMGIKYGAIMISEGVFHDMSKEELEKTGVHFSYDDHGHPELGKISKAQMFNDMLEKATTELGLGVKSRPVEIGYDVRCVTPIAYDLMYCSQLGMGVYKLFEEGITGCMVYMDIDNNIKPLFLEDLQDPATGKIPPRRVNIKTDKIQQVFKYIMNYITPADYEAAKQYVPNPEEYDFKKILNW